MFRRPSITPGTSGVRGYREGHLGYNDCPSAAKENITQLASVSFHGAHVQTGCECSKYVSPPPPLLSIAAFGARTPRRANIRP